MFNLILQDPRLLIAIPALIWLIFGFFITKGITYQDFVEHLSLFNRIGMLFLILAMSFGLAYNSYLMLVFCVLGSLCYTINDYPKTKFFGFLRKTLWFAQELIVPILFILILASGSIK